MRRKIHLNSNLEAQEFTVSKFSMTTWQKNTLIPVEINYLKSQHNFYHPKRKEKFSSHQSICTCLHAAFEKTSSRSLFWVYYFHKKEDFHEAFVMKECAYSMIIYV